jgi:hypothetical protein
MTKYEQRNITKEGLMIKNQWTKVATSDEKVASSDQKVATSGQNVTREKRRYYTFETKKRLKYIPKMC